MILKAERLFSRLRLREVKPLSFFSTLLQLFCADKFKVLSDEENTPCSTCSSP